MEKTDQERQQAPSPVIVEKGEDPRVLVIAFTGFASALMMTPFDFFQVSGLLKYSRILLRDDTKRCFLGGLPPIAESFAQLLDWIRARIRDLAPEKILAIGTSAGAGTAMMAGHELKVDFTHAFSPYTFMDMPNIVKYNTESLVPQYTRYLEHIWALPAEVHKYFDTAELLKTGNGVTRHYVHVCKKSPLDMLRARHVSHCPNVKVFAYDCSDHFVTQHLADWKQLLTLLKIENQENLGRVLRVRPEVAGGIPKEKAEP